jgi:hypothetical protein
MKAMEISEDELFPINCDENGNLTNMQSAVYASPVYANSTLFVAAGRRLFAIAGGSDDAVQRDAGRTITRPNLPLSSIDRRPPRPIFVPTPGDVVERMLELAEIKKGDLVVDLGSGDGRIVIAAANTYGCRAIGYEIDSDLVRESRDRVNAEALSEIVTINNEDMFTANLSKVDVVAAYLYPSALVKLKRQFEQLKPGARIVSHRCEIPGVEPNRRVVIRSHDSGEAHDVLLYVTPLRSVENDLKRK